MKRRLINIIENFENKKIHIFNENKVDAILQNFNTDWKDLKLIVNKILYTYDGLKGYYKKTKELKSLHIQNQQIAMQLKNIIDNDYLKSEQYNKINTERIISLKDESNKYLVTQFIRHTNMLQEVRKKDAQLINKYRSSIDLLKKINERQFIEELDKTGANIQANTKIKQLRNLVSNIDKDFGDRILPQKQ